MKLLKILALSAFFGLAIFFLILQCVQLSQQGASRETLVVVSELLLFLFFGLVFLLRKRLSQLLDGAHPLAMYFVVIGYLVSVVAETAYIFSKPLHRNLLIDLLLTAPWYIMWMMLWYRILKRFRFSVMEAFILGGFHGFVVEAVVSGYLFASPILALLGLPLFSVVYGFFFIVPYLLLKNNFKDQKEISFGKKVAWSLVPLLAYIPGFIWIMAVTLVFKLTLH